MTNKRKRKVARSPSLRSRLRYATLFDPLRSARIPALGLLALALLQQALHDPTLHLVLAPALAPLGITEYRADLHAVGLDRAGGRAGSLVVLGLVGMLRLEFVSVLWLGLVVGFGVLVLVLFGVVLGFGVAVVLLVGFGVLGLDGVDSACGWLGWRGDGVLAEGLIVGGCVLVLGGLVGVVGVLGDFDGLDGGVRVGGLVSVVVVGVLG